MKKTLLLVIFFFYSLTFLGQVQTEEYKEIVETNLSKDQMCFNLKKYIPIIFLNKNYKVESEDKESGIMIIKWSSNLPVVLSNYSMSKGYLTLTIESSVIIEIKDNKYRYTVPYGKIIVTLESPSSEDLQFMGETAIKLILKDMKLIEEISSKYYNKSMIWTMNEIYDNIIKDFSNVNRSQEYIFLNEIKKTYSSEIINIKENIKKNIITIDDF